MQNEQHNYAQKRIGAYLDPVEFDDVYRLILYHISDDHKRRYGLWLEENEPHFWGWGTRLYMNNRSYPNIARTIERLLDIYVR